MFSSEKEEVCRRTRRLVESEAGPTLTLKCIGATAMFFTFKISVFNSKCTSSSLISNNTEVSLDLDQLVKVLRRSRRSEDRKWWGYLGDKGAAVGKEAEFRGEPKGEVGERRRGLPSRSPLCSFHSSSSFSMDRRLLTLDSFCSVCCSLACSLDSCLQGETESSVG